MAQPPPGWLEAKARLISTAIKKFDAAGDLSRLSLDELDALAKHLEDALAATREIIAFIDGNKPSTFWFVLNVGVGIAGLLTLGPGVVALILALGGALGAGKSLYDWTRHLADEQRQFGTFYAIASRKDALTAELLRRGVLPG